MRVLCFWHHAMASAIALDQTKPATLQMRSAVRTPGMCDSDLHASYLAAVKMAELAGIERKFMEMKAERQKSLRDVQESGDKGV